MPARYTKNHARLRALRPLLDDLYDRYNQPQFIDPDPLAAVLRFAAPQDQEIVGLIAASLAFGNVKTILASIDKVLAVLPAPHRDLRAATPGELARALGGFRHRYAAEDDMLALLLGMQAEIAQHGSLAEAFRTHLQDEHTHVLPALAGFSHALRAATGHMKNPLLADAAKGSANKRWCMYLRWMLRRDAVDPGPWHGQVPASMLVVPLDTHMHRFCTALRLSQRKAADRRTVEEITAAFRVIHPEDPTRYDFALTRLGIRRETDATRAFLQAVKDATARSA